MRRWERVRERLQAAQPEFPDSALWRRIEASRAGAALVELPRETSRFVARAILYGVGIGALGLAYAASRSTPSVPEVQRPGFSWSLPLFPEAAFAQGSQTKHFAAIPPPDGRKVRPGRWIYEWNLRHDVGQGANPRIADTVTIRRGTLRNEPVWLVTTSIHRTSTRGGGRLDSLYLKARDLGALRGATFWYRPGELINATSMDFEPGILRWRFRVPGGSGRDTTAVLRLPAEYTAPPLLFGLLSILVAGLELRDGWSAGIPFLFPRTDRLEADSVVGVYWFNLRVVGRERVRVPAGTFDCWRVAFSIPSQRESVTELWIDRKEGFLVQESPGPLSYSTEGRKLVAVLP
jgi:hypothetical protein